VELAANGGCGLIHIFGLPGSCFLSNSPQVVEAKTLPHKTKQTAGKGLNSAFMREGILQGLKPKFILRQLSARLKPCPNYKTPVFHCPIEFFRNLESCVLLQNRSVS
jgi:hypothetical protein